MSNAKLNIITLQTCWYYADLWLLNICVKQTIPTACCTRYVSGYKYFTKLDISRQCYTSEHDKESQDICFNITSFSKYKYQCLPISLKCALDFAQQIMEEVLRGLDNVKVNHENIGLFANMWEEFLLLNNKVLSCLETNGLAVNPLKCKWTVHKTDWLG